MHLGALKYALGICIVVVVIWILSTSSIQYWEQMDRRVYTIVTNHKANTTKPVRVLCWVMTAPSTLYTKGKAVKKTWGKRCDTTLFFSSKNDTSFPAIGLNVSEGRQHLTEKTMQAFEYIYKHHFSDAEWFMKTDDDTYVIVENLKYFLSDKNENLPVFYGHWFKTIVSQGYYSGGAGYVLSKESLRRFGERDKKQCVKTTLMEDIDMGVCMKTLGVKTASSLDAKGRSRFHCLPPHDHVLKKYPYWFENYDKYEGKLNVSDYAISFHYVTPSDMFLLDYYVYHLKPYGLYNS